MAPAARAWLATARNCATSTPCPPGVITDTRPSSETRACVHTSNADKSGAGTDARAAAAPAAAGATGRAGTASATGGGTGAAAPGATGTTGVASGAGAAALLPTGGAAGATALSLRLRSAVRRRSSSRLAGWASATTAPCDSCAGACWTGAGAGTYAALSLTSPSTFLAEVCAADSSGRSARAGSGCAAFSAGAGLGAGAGAGAGADVGAAAGAPVEGKATEGA
jgi:hypothetical protein